MKVKAELNNLRISPRKVKLVADLICGMYVAEALSQLDVTVKKTSEYLKKLLLSAVANAENNFGLAKDNLYIFQVTVGAGQTMKRWMPKAYGRAGQILKRTAKVKIVLEERVEGKGRKTKEEREKERKAKLKEMAAELKQKEAKAKEEKSAKKTEERGIKPEEKSKTVKNDTKTWTNRIFRRKSM